MFTFLPGYRSRPRSRFPPETMQENRGRVRTTSLPLKEGVTWAPEDILGWANHLRDEFLRTLHSCQTKTHTSSVQFWQRLYNFPHWIDFTPPETTWSQRIRNNKKTNGVSQNNDTHWNRTFYKWKQDVANHMVCFPPSLRLRYTLQLQNFITVRRAVVFFAEP